MAGDRTLAYQPGDTVPVLVEADSTGTVATEGDGVALKGEDADAVVVELVEQTSDRCVGILTEDPEDWRRDPSLGQADFDADDEAGMAELALAHPVFFLKTDAGYSPTVGDYVEVGDGGDIEAYTGPTAVGQDGAVTNALGIDANGQLENPTAGDIDVDFTQDAFPFGMVFSAIARSWGVGERTAVLKGVL